MNLRDWMGRAMGDGGWAKMEQTLPGALSKTIDEMLYNMADESGGESRGRILKLSHSEKMYVGLREKDWPKWDGRLEANKYGGTYVDVKKTLRTIQYLLEAYAFNECYGGRHNSHICKHCGSAAP